MMRYFRLLSMMRYFWFQWWGISHLEFLQFLCKVYIAIKNKWLFSHGLSGLLKTHIYLIKILFSFTTAIKFGTFSYLGVERSMVTTKFIKWKEDNKIHCFDWCIQKNNLSRTKLNITNLFSFTAFGSFDTWEITSHYFFFLFF